MPSIREFIRFVMRPDIKFGLPHLFPEQSVFRWLAIVLMAGSSYTGMASADNFGRAEKLFFAGNYEKCIEQSAFAIGVGDEAERWYLLKINSEMATGAYAEALATLNEGLEANVNSIQLRLTGYDVWKHNNNLQRARELLLEFDDLVQYRRWRYRDMYNQIAQGKYLLLLRGDAKEVLDEYFLPAMRKSPDQAIGYLAIGNLGLAKHDYALAEEYFTKATKRQPENPEGFLGLALAWKPSDLEKSSQAISNAMRLNANYIPGLHYLVNDRIDSERYSEAIEYIERILKINSRDPVAWSYRAVIAHLQNDPDGESEAREQAFAVWDSNPQVDHLIGRKLSQKYRFSEGAKLQRRALTYDPRYLPARIQLANDLLRLGNDQEGWRLADEVYQEDGYNVVAYNLVTLGNTMSKFTVLQADGFIVRMEPREAEIYGDMVLDLLREAKQELVDKYEAEVVEPIFVEIFPNQQDFAVRTFGLPGGSGYLGVCFGRVITMNSPKSQSRIQSNWKSVLWHEYCHVVTLQKTGNKMPRWLSEGISVYEEGQKDSSWGQPMSPEYREMLLGDQLTPVSQLSSAFMKPDSGQALQFAYFESSLVVEYLVETYGIEVLKKILADLNTGMSINEVLGRYTGDVRLLDREFAEYARNRAREMAPQANWDKPKLPASASLEQWQEWNAEHPDNFYGIRAEATLQYQSKNLDAAEILAQKMLDIYPEYTGSDNAFSLLSLIAKARGDQRVEFEMLKKSGELQAAGTDVFTRLATISSDREEWSEAIKQAERWLAVNPLIPAPHRVIAAAAEKKGDYPRAATALRALTKMDPFDPADTWYRYAVALKESGKTELAKRQVLKCLEEAPRYREAHRLWLELNESGEPETTEQATVTDEDH